MTEEPRLFWCICCEEYHFLDQIQENGLCKQCDDMVKRWEKPWEPSYRTSLFGCIVECLLRHNMA